jgi:hypothetical protein
MDPINESPDPPLDLDPMVLGNIPHRMLQERISKRSSVRLT